MSDIVIGRGLRALRLRARLRQKDVADQAGVSQQLVSKLEHGKVATISLRTLREVAAALEADVVTRLTWRAGELDRLLDEGHAAVVGRISGLLVRDGWQILTEVTFAEWGERGSIDILAWHAASRTLVVIEVKTEITSAEETLRRHDTKVRLAPRICRERFGEVPAHVGRLLVVADDMRNRRRVARLAQVLGPAYPVRGRDVRAWLAAPRGDLRGLVFTGRASVDARMGRRPRRIRSTGA
jgi:transcriptional regulator with XRE-family HTH domain